MIIWLCKPVRKPMMVGQHAAVTLEENGENDTYEENHSEEKHG